MPDVEQVEDVEIDGLTNSHNKSNNLVDCDDDNDDDDEDEDDDDVDVDADNCYRKYYINCLVRIVFSTPGLLIIVIVYSIMGAIIFPLIEAPNEFHNTISIKKTREECLKELWIITERLNVLYEKNWTLLVNEQLRRFEGTIEAATKGGFFFETINEQFPRWSFIESLLYSVAIITTIGHGNLTPSTSEGKIVTIVYAVIGVPLMLMCLSNVGGFLANTLLCTYNRLSGRTQILEIHKNEQDSEYQQHRQRILNNADQIIQIKCNNCKKTKITAKSNKLQNYDKYDSVNNTKDSCHLLCNSTSSCMQLDNLNRKNHNRQNAKNVKNYYKNVMPDNKCCSPTNNNNNNGRLLLGSSTTTTTTTKTTPNINTNTNLNQNVYLPQNYVHYNHISKTMDHRNQPSYSHKSFELQSHNNNNNCNSQPPINRLSIQQKIHQHSHQHNQRQIFYHHQHSPTTATVRGIGRSKFLPKPLPQEINVLLSECDTNFHHKLTDTTNSNKCSENIVEAVDEDDDDDGLDDNPDDDDYDDYNRGGFYNHGTPSRTPLIRGNDQCKPSYYNDDEIQNYHYNNSNNDPDIQSTDIVNLNNEMIIEEDNDDDDDENIVDNCDDDQNDHDNDLINQEILKTSYVPITLIVLILLCYISIGTVIFSLWENWSLIDGAYFCFVTFTTIGGFGDLIPMRTFNGQHLQIFACCVYLLLGLFLLAMSFNLLETQLFFKCKRLAIKLKLTTND